jgi:hypothetical protein
MSSPHQVSEDNRFYSKSFLAGAATVISSWINHKHEIYCEKKNDAKVSSNSTAAQKAEDNARAEVLRKASLGMLTPPQKSGLQERRSGGKELRILTRLVLPPLVTKREQPQAQ